MVCVKTIDGRMHRRRARDRQEARSRLTELIKEMKPLLSYTYRQWLVRQRKQREGLRPSVRFDVLHRDGFRCVYCGATAKVSPLHVDHVVPVVKGGSDEMSNLVTACADCNLGKGDREAQLPVEDTEAA